MRWVLQAPVLFCALGVSGADPPPQIRLWGEMQDTVNQVVWDTAAQWTTTRRAAVAPEVVRRISTATYALARDACYADYPHEIGKQCFPYSNPESIRSAVRAYLETLTQPTRESFPSRLASVIRNPEVGKPWARKETGRLCAPLGRYAGRKWAWYSRGVAVGDVAVDMVCTGTLSSSRFIDLDRPTHQLTFSAASKRLEFTRTTAPAVRRVRLLAFAPPIARRCSGDGGVERTHSKGKRVYSNDVYPSSPTAVTRAALIDVQLFTGAEPGDELLLSHTIAAAFSLWADAGLNALEAIRFHYSDGRVELWVREDVLFRSRASDSADPTDSLPLPYLFPAERFMRKTAFARWVNSFVRLDPEIAPSKYAAISQEHLFLVSNDDGTRCPPGDDVVACAVPRVGVYLRRKSFVNDWGDTLWGKGRSQPAVHVLAHEIGHWLGEPHLDVSREAYTIMDSDISSPRHCMSLAEGSLVYMSSFPDWQDRLTECAGLRDKRPPERSME